MVRSNRDPKLPLGRLAFYAAIAMAALVADAQTAAHASWCANYQTGGTNCGFSSFQACQATVSGVGGNCNQILDGAEKSESSRERVRRERPEPKKREAAPKRLEPVRESAPVKPALAPAQTPAPVPAAAAAPVQRTPQLALDFAGARQLILNGQYEAGIAAMRALKFDDHPDIAAFVGLAYRKLGRLDEARSWYERALAADPNHKLAISFYGMLRAENGDRAKAQADLERLGQICGGTECSEYQALAGVLAWLPR